MLMQNYSVKEKAGQREIQRVQFQEKKNTRKCNAGAKFCAQADEKLKERSDSTWSKVTSHFRARPHLANLSASER